MPTHVIGPQVRAPSRAHSSWTGLRLSRPPFLRVLRFQPDASGAGRPRSADGGSLRLPPAFFTRAAARVLAVKRGLPTAAGGCPRADPLVLGMRVGRGAPRMNHAGRGRLVFVSRACEGACTCVHEGEPAVASMGAHVRARPRVRSPRRPCTPVCPRTLTPAIPACTDAGTGRGPRGGGRAGRLGSRCLQGATVACSRPSAAKCRVSPLAPGRQLRAVVWKVSAHLCREHVEKRVEGLARGQVGIQVVGDGGGQRHQLAVGGPPSLGKSFRPCIPTPPHSVSPGCHTGEVWSSVETGTGPRATLHLGVLPEHLLCAGAWVALRKCAVVHSHIPEEDASSTPHL